MRHGRKTASEATCVHNGRNGYQLRWCNLCSDEFTPGSAFERFCPGCREESELYRFSEWLPIGAEREDDALVS